MRSAAAAIALLGLLVPSAALGQNSRYNINRVAGFFSRGDGGPAIAAMLDFPQAVTVDGKGNFFIADSGGPLRRVDAGSGIISTVPGGSYAYDVKLGSDGNFYVANFAWVLKVTPAGETSVVAGTGNAGYNGDEIPAGSAQVNYPTALALDAAGNIYIADRYNHRIRKVAPDGIIHTVAGTGTAGYNGDGIQATLASLSAPQGIAVDSAGNLNIADTGNCRIRMVTPAGIIATIAGTGVCRASGDGGLAMQAGAALPISVARDGAGNLFVSESGRVRRISAAGLITTVAGNGTAGYSGDGGPALAAQVDPAGLAFDSVGNLLIADSGSSRVRMVTPDGAITTATGSSRFGGDGGPAVSSRLFRPYFVAFDRGGNMYLSDTLNHRVRKVDTSGVITTYAGTGLRASNAISGIAANVNIGDPVGVAFDAAGNLYIADNYNCRVYRVSPEGSLQTIAGTGVLGYDGDGGDARSARLSSPTGLAVDQAGNLYIADAYNYRVRKVSPDGIIATVAGTGAAGAGSDGIPATESALNYVDGIAVDKSGNLYIADEENYRVRMVNPAGIVTTVAGNGKPGMLTSATNGKPATSVAIGLPYGVVVDDEGNLYYSEYTFIGKVDRSGVLTVIAGDGQRGYSGDGGPATSASILLPQGLALDANGDLYFADTENSCIRRLAPSRPHRRR